MAYSMPKLPSPIYTKHTSIHKNNDDVDVDVDDDDNDDDDDDDNDDNEDDAMVLRDALTLYWCWWLNVVSWLVKNV
uniref:Uncharacterized protein n=1 Tax=Glossina morsitans morsitans TaxID=37546 RepID=A0A1B0FPG3_GLOMM